MCQPIPLDKRRKSQACKDQRSQVLRWSQYSKASWGRSHWSLVSMTRQHGVETWLEVAVQGKVLAHRPLPLGCFTSWVIFMVKMIERALCFLVPDNPGSSTLTLCVTSRLQLFLIQTHLLALADGWPVALHLSSVYQQPPFCCKMVVWSWPLHTCLWHCCYSSASGNNRSSEHSNNIASCNRRHSLNLWKVRPPPWVSFYIRPTHPVESMRIAQHLNQLLMEWYKSVGK